MSGYLAVTTINLLILVVLAIGGIALWWGLLRLMDKHNGVAFHNEIHRFRYPEVYYGLRALATAWIVAELAGRFV